jgi:hypothetical protein
VQLEGFPPHKSHSRPGSNPDKPPHDPAIGFFPKNNPIDIREVIASKTRNIKKASNISIF